MRTKKVIPNNSVLHGREKRDRDVQSAGTPNVCILREVLVPQVEVEVLRVVQTAQQTSGFEVVDALAPVLAAPVVWVQTTSQWNRSEAT